VSAGADWLGFNFYPPSPRSISSAACRQIVGSLRSALGANASQVRLVGVFVNARPAAVLRTLDECTLDLAQLSGDETPEDLRACGGRAYRALRAGRGDSLAGLFCGLPSRDAPPAALVDAAVPGEYGGTGRLADWEQARALAADHAVFLAGGLSPGNVADAVRCVRPWGVDAASGIESAPGKKDAEKMRRFVDLVRRASIS
jgi:phosphoribosylanthranilate isomerase